jgi:ubiquinone/menaquinone biosynthesis C-methylase UbiE
MSRIGRAKGDKMNSISIAASLMKLLERAPVFSEGESGRLSEFFQHDVFTGASGARREELMLKSSQAKYEGEEDYPWDNYFGFSLRSHLEGKVVLDLGCFTGGRSVAWAERYGLRCIAGVDVEPAYIEAATLFGRLHGVHSQFKVGYGEELPFEDNSFDAILSFDVLEHVRNVGKTLDECYRVLRPQGQMFLVFPSYWHPDGHHLSLVTRMPCIHYWFGGDTLVKAYCKILQERGASAYWYRRSSPNLEPWERGNTINGTTLWSFRALLRRRDWKVVRHVRKPIGGIGRNATRSRVLGLASKAFAPLTFVPGVQELVTHRITYVLQKNDSGG